MSNQNVNNGQRTRNTENNNQVGQGVGSVGVGDISASLDLGFTGGSDDFIHIFEGGDLIANPRVKTQDIVIWIGVGLLALFIYQKFIKS